MPGGPAEEGSGEGLGRVLLLEFRSVDSGKETSWVCKFRLVISALLDQKLLACSSYFLFYLFIFLAEEAL